MTEKSGAFEALLLTEAVNQQQREQDQQERIATIEAELKRWKTCNTCGGSPHPSGLVCICGGTGAAVDELSGLRSYVLKLEAERDRLRAALRTIRDADTTGEISEYAIDGLRHVAREALAATEQPTEGKDADA